MQNLLQKSNSVTSPAVLSYKLHHIHLPSAAILCNDLLCTNRDHIDAISAYADAISDACLSAANGCIPHTCHQHSKGRIPGWSERVDPFRQKSLLWHKIWDECGRPRSGVVADCMRRSRAKYHYTLRQVRRDENDIVRQRSADALVGDPSRSFWAEIKNNT